MPEIRYSTPEVVRHWHLKTLSVAPAKPHTRAEVRTLLVRAAAFADEMEEEARRLTAPRGSSKDRVFARELLSRAGDLRELSFVLIWLLGRPDLEISEASVQDSWEPRKPIVLATTPEGSEPDGEATTAFANPLAHLQARLLSSLEQLMRRDTNQSTPSEDTQTEPDRLGPDPFRRAATEPISSDDPTLLDFPPSPSAAASYPAQIQHSVREAS
jgi:hypothetical protein